MALSPHELRILATIEDDLGKMNSAPAGAGTSLLRWFPLSAIHLGLLVLVLLALILLHPVADAAGPVGLGMLTVALIVPWLVMASRGTGSPPGSPKGRRTG